MPHVIVETNWLFAYAAPAHHRVLAAADLLQRAQRGEFILHVPNLCFGEARQAIRAKCQPRREAEAIRRFLNWAEPAGQVSKQDGVTIRTVLSKYESGIKRDLDLIDVVFRDLAAAPYVQIFGLDEEMLDRSTELALSGIELKPFDHAVLAAVLVRSSRLWNAGERTIAFCEADSDLQPWDKLGNAKPQLVSVYDQAHTLVYGDFTLTEPPRRRGFPTHPLR